MDIVKGTIIYLEDEQYFTLPNYVTKVRLEVHGGRGGDGGDAYGNKRGNPGSNGSRISCILDLSKVPTSSRTLYAVKGHNGENGGSGGWRGGGGGGGGGGGSSAILLGDILIIQARGGAGGSGANPPYNGVTAGSGGKGGKGYINGENGEEGKYSYEGRGGAGGGSDYIFEGLESLDATIEYTPGLLLLEVLEGKPTLIKSNNKYYTYQNNEFIEVEPTVENFKEKSIYLPDLTTPTDKVVLTMEGGEELGDGKIFRKTINVNKYKDIENIYIL